jgi:hypothetical protein
MNFVLINKRNNNFGLTKSFNRSPPPTNKNYVIHDRSKQNLNTSKSTGLRNMFSLIQYAKTSCGSCGGAR